MQIRLVINSIIWSCNTPLEIMFIVAEIFNNIILSPHPNFNRLLLFARDFSISSQKISDDSLIIKFNRPQEVSLQEIEWQVTSLKRIKFLQSRKSPWIICSIFHKSTFPEKKLILIFPFVFIRKFIHFIKHFDSQTFNVWNEATRCWMPTHAKILRYILVHHFNGY